MFKVLYYEREKKNVERDPSLGGSREDRSCMEVGEVQRRT